MSREDWYRNEEWSNETQQEFWSRWKRSRTAFHKAQYLKIQGSILANSSDSELASSGRELLHQVIEEFPRETMEVGGAWDAIGSSFEKHGFFEKAVEAYQTCMDVFDTYTGNVDTGADIKLAYLIASEGMWEYSDLAMGYVKRKLDAEESNPFPLHWFRLLAAQALIAHQIGDTRQAASAASQAIDAAQIKRTLLQYHSDIGLVDLADPKANRVVRKLFQISSKP